MKLTAEQIVEYIRSKGMEAAYCGDIHASIDGFCSLTNPKPGCLSWIKHLEKFDFAGAKTAPEMIFISDSPEGVVPPDGYNVIQCDDPKAAFFGILNQFWSKPHAYGIAPTSIVEANRIGKNLTVGHHCYIGPDVVIGDDVYIENNVVIQNRASIGSNTIIRSGAVIGVDGFGFFKDENGENCRVEHFGGVVIGEDVEIGAGCCVSRGTLGDTVIERNVKLDSLCHVGHNAFVGKKSMLTAMTMLAGSCKLTENVYVGPNSLIMNQITVGKDSYLGLGTVAIKDIPENKVVAGVPARILRDNYSEK